MSVRLAVLIFLVSFEVIAGGLSAPIDFPSTGVLPKGIRNLRYKGIFVNATQKLNNTGAREELGAAMNTQVTWQKMLDSKDDDPVEQGVLKGFIKDHLKQQGKSDLNESVGETTGAVNVAADISVPVMAYGLTSMWTLAIAVPVVKSRIDVDKGFVKNKETERLLEKLTGDEANPRQLKAEELTRDMRVPLDKTASDNGYDPVENQQKSELGDIKLVSKILPLNEEKYALAFTQELTLPTGKRPGINKLIDLGSGDGQWDIGVGVIGQYNISRRWNIVQSISYTAQLPASIESRIPEKGDSSATPDIDQSVDMDIGDIAAAQTAIEHKFFNGFSAKLGYSFQYKFEDSFSGDQYASYRYEWMERNTQQRLHSAQLGLGYSTIELFKQKKFIAPLGVNLVHSRVLEGKNVTADPLTTFELYMFF